jgi:thioredoxin reductase (NADPH)
VWWWLSIHSKNIEYDLILVGAGPCGLAAAAIFKQAGMKYLHLESGRIAQTIYNFPRKIHLYSKRAGLEIKGVPFLPHPEQSPTREEYIKYLKSAVRKLKLRVMTRVNAQRIITGSKRHLLRAGRRDGKMAEYSARNIVVASGGYFAPVLLHIPGENQPNVSHYFHSEIPARGKTMLVVGGRNSAVEAAIMLAQKQAKVILAYRSSKLPRRLIKLWLLPQLDDACKEGRIHIHYRTVPTRIRNHSVELHTESAGTFHIEADRVFLLTGYGPDFELLKRANIPLHKRTERPLFSSRTLETLVPGIFLCGTVVLKWKGEKASIENTQDHGNVILNNLR